MEYMSVKQAAVLWGIPDRCVRLLCEQGKVDGAKQEGRTVNKAFVMGMNGHLSKPIDLDMLLAAYKNSSAKCKPDIVDFQVTRRIRDLMMINNRAEKERKKEREKALWGMTKHA